MEQIGILLFRQDSFLFHKICYAFASTQMVSVVSIASFTSSSIFSSSLVSDLLMILIFGLVTGCLATKIVQQSSYGKIDVS